MGALLSGFGVLCAGLAVATGLARAARLPAWWAALAALPVGVTAYGVLLLPCVRLAGPRGGTVLASTTAAVGLGLLAWRLRAGGPWRRRADAGPDHLGWATALGLLVAAGAIGLAGGRFALAVISAAPTPPLLGDPSTGDWGLHVLRAAVIARHGVPPPSPLDPDYALQYRYLFHVLAAVVAVRSETELPTSSAVVSGAVLGCLVLAGGTLAFVVRQSKPEAVSAALLAALYGPSYLLPEAARQLSAGVLPTPAALAALMPEKWAMSPLASAFPTMLTAQGSSPTLPLAALSWLVTLTCAGCALRAGDDRAARWSAAGAGAALATVAFTADFFLPVAILAIGAGALVGRRAPLAMAGLVLAGGATFGAVLLLLLLSTGQLGAAGAARDLRVAINSSAGITPVYGGSHALLAGGSPVPLPNWIHVHDWGILFWPGLAAAVWRRQPVLLAGAAAAFGSGVVWHALEVTYTTGTPTDTRVQMYRYASLSAGVLAPLLPVAVSQITRRLPIVVRTACQVLLLIVGAGAGGYWVILAIPITAQTQAQWIGDVSLARRLALESGPRRLAVLNAPSTFLEMYNPGPGGHVPLWWAFGETPMPVGWDFGYPERYVPLYRRVVVDLDPRAAAELGITHVAVAPAAIPPERRAALDRFLTDCRAERVARMGGPTDSAARELYRLGSNTCTPSGAPA